MIKNIFKAIGCLSLVVTAFNPALAQENQTPASVAKLKMQNIWMNNTNNAAGGVVDASKVYSISSFGITTAEGDFKMVQDGTDNLTYGLKTEGGGIYEKLNNMFMWGSLSYTRDAMDGTKFNCLAYDPFRDVPFLLADSISSKWVRQEYDLQMKMASPELFGFLTLGLSGSYISGLSAKQVDPLARMDVSHFGWGASALMNFGKHNIGFNFNHSNRREDGNAGIVNSKNTARAWDYVAPGFFREAEFGAFGSLIDNRYFHMHTLGGGVQYGFKNDHWNILLTGDYMLRVEDINNEQLSSSPGTGRQMIGTVKEHNWSGKFITNYTFNNGNMLSLNASYEDRSVDGIEYFQEFDNTYEVQAWLVKAKYIRSNISKVNTEVKLDYIVSDGANSYKWWFGVNYANRTNDWLYYLPAASQNVTNNVYGLFASRNFKFNDKNSLTVSLNGGWCSNSEGTLNYAGEGTQADNAGWTDFTLKDFYYLTSGYTNFGYDLTYAYSGFKRSSLSLFVSIASDYYAAKSDMFEDRGISSFKIGVSF